MSEPERCALCGMEITGDPVEREFDGRVVRFDTTGCAEVYAAALAAGVLDEVLTEGPARPGALERLTRKHDTVFFQLDGMWCATCAISSRRLLEHAPGVLDAQVNFAAGTGRVDFDPDVIDTDTLMHRLESLGYRPRLMTDESARDAESAEERTLIQAIVAVAFMMQVMLIYLVQLYGLYHDGDFTSVQVRALQYLAWLLATPALFFGGQSFLRGAWHAVRARTANMDTLVTLGTLAAYGYSVYASLVGGLEAYFDSVVMITSFVMIGRYLEMLGGSRARKDVRALLRLQPERAWLAEGGENRRVRVAELGVGDTIAVKEGERVPIDGEVVSGGGSVNEAMLTGESSPVTKRPGDRVFAGTLLVEGSLDARVESLAEETRLASIRHLVEQTLASKAPAERLADRASAWLTGLVLAVSAATLGLGLALGLPLAAALIRAVAVLVVACPCALGLATPLAVSISLGKAAVGGVIVRNARALETAASVTRAAFDKTGTLTAGDLAVIDVVGAQGVDAGRVLRDAASVEARSSHPLARAIVSEAARQGALSREQVTGYEASRGDGVAATTAGGHDIRVGREEFMPARPVGDLLGRTEGQAEAGNTVVWVARDDVVEGALVLRDSLMPGAPEAIAEFGEMGIATCLLSGDSAATTGAIAHRLGITEWHARLLPAEKARLILDWRTSGERVLMVGDGINDAPALAAADVSVAASGGTDVASETSDVVMTHKDLESLSWFLRLSAATGRIIRQNLAWALGYNLIALPLAASGTISPALAAAAMATSSVLVVGNSLRLRRA